MKLFAKKSLGQHFLNSTHVLRQIILAAHIQKGESVLEIGPGTGVLTRALLDAGANVIAIEKDSRAVGMLEQDFFNEIKSGTLKIIEGDVLDPNILKTKIKSDQLSENSSSENPESSNDSIIKPSHSGSLNCLILESSKYALVANIPYYITGAILEKFLEYEPRPNRMVLLVQKEVAQRIVARDDKESVLSISVKAFGTPKIIAEVPPGAFTPPPTVDSAILSIENISDNLFRAKNFPDVSKDLDIPRFFRLVKTSFAHKRKFLARNLEVIFGQMGIEAIWKKLGLDPKIRAEDLKVEQWLEIAGYNSLN
ncbi:MAG: hypothetical protein A3C79_02980 [Candidatus Taylorbacteria bacterium RIFCSPHIGHO2_02_FULL_45_28]|uniref:Ribosomal RNA small subunit methyltransferase A n=1 Tax=Candidatus Taylorbacteria bacterium RIFCSPHIGHO2_12_FULL_45_16 TaxID=1802315 RepID=A0A1G2N140_9BACT|nr:MAG: hypothetical protein A2830_00700 [Candidatus Taylorbacteria bacterium RIFCSPHIGHO2_01_FULL_44_110]OHA24925.1 MAG: hypothetical protein A3C79_02980 [Candidatus Taylorbacteria bacterium RIFCSPHIGHO2_02_FULL_45_28]OHA29743.1 MAG: hypothetical protein A3F51_03395 [Candidatus Taylorbacteria bacterium RIFCSPHIGHO2_12_FULL_45_16]OHA32687.1 MAG: hypothetical protein A3A23_00265 [Candidatus Taylorbacteria bacterium RIFCSPLOWO2_01_FULL_45_59]OHA38842.1 MAG: hypothetical protein A3I98_01705 [Candi